MSFHKIAKVLAVTGVLLLLAAAPAKAEGPRTETVQFPNGKANTASGFLAVPEKTGRYAAVIVAPEWWGLTDWMKEQTEKLAAAGYVVLAVDFYGGGKIATDATQANELGGALTPNVAVGDLVAAYSYLATRQDVDRDHIAAIGWGMGAGYVLRLAMIAPRMAACIINYGPLPTDPNDLQVIYSPVLGNFGADDHGITVADVNEFQKVMNNLKRRVDIKIYPGAGHAFENPSSASYQPEAAADAWARTIAFLNKTMK